MYCIRVMIACKDWEYGHALAEGLANLQRGFLISCAEPGADGFAEAAACADLVLTDVTGTENGQLQNKTLLLTEVRPESETDSVLYKYDRVSVLAERLRWKFRSLTGKRCLLTSNGKGLMIGFCSGSGGVGKSVLAISAARELAEERRKRVLYLSFEPLNAAEVYMKKRRPVSPMGDYLYYLFSGKENVLSDPGAFLACDEYGVETFCSIDGRNELSGLNWEQTEQVLDALLRQCSHDYICLDFDGNGSEVCRKLAVHAFKTFWVRKADAVSVYKQKALFRSFSFSFDEPMFTEVVNFDRGLETHGGISVPEDRSSFREQKGGTEILLHRDFGMGVRKIVEEIRRDE